MKNKIFALITIFALVAALPLTANATVDVAGSCTTVFDPTTGLTDLVVGLSRNIGKIEPAERQVRNARGPHVLYDATDDILERALRLLSDNILKKLSLVGRFL